MLLLAGFLFMVFMFAMLGVLTGAPAVFLDAPSALCLLVPLVFFLCASGSGTILGGYVAKSFKKEYAYAEAELKALSTAAKNTARFILSTGAVLFLAGVAASLFYLESKDTLGPNLAVSLLTLLYSAAASCFVFLPVQAWAENKRGR